MIEYSKILVTPSMAQAYLELNKNNRRVKEDIVSRYAADIKYGRWKEDTGETIKIADDGSVLDGQHRLLAVIKADKPTYFHFAMNVKKSVFDVIDTGSVRNAPDAFRVAGITQYNTIPSIIGVYNQLKNGNTTKERKNTRANNTILLEKYNERPLFWLEVAKLTHGWYVSFAKMLQPSYIGGLYAFLLEKGGDKAFQFMEQLTTGIDIENPTITLLRNKLIQDRMAIRKVQPSTKLAFIIKTWNYYIKGDTVKLLKFVPEVEQFPVAINYFDIK